MPAPSIAQSDWLMQALTSDLSKLCIAILVVALVVLLLCLKAMLRFGKEAKVQHRQNLLHDNAGVATIEFCLVLPIALFMILLLAQTTLAMAGNMYVHYSASAATRAAIVQIPQDYGGASARNMISNSPGDEKYEAIRRAAVFALVPVSGRGESNTQEGKNYISGLKNLYTQYGRNEPNWLKPTQGYGDWKGYPISSIEAALYYADENTDIYVMETIIIDEDDVEFERITGIHEFGPKDPITVQVEHKMHLGVPYVRWIFSDTEVNQGTYTTKYDAEAKSYDYDSGADDRKYRTITAQYTMTNEGIDDQLPEPPPIPRRP